MKKTTYMNFLNNVNECGCAALQQSGVGEPEDAISPLKRQDRSADSAGAENAAELPGTVTPLGQIEVYNNPVIKSTTGDIRNTDTSTYVSNFLGKSVTEQSGEYNMLSSLIEKYLLDDTKSKEKFNIDKLIESVSAEDSTEEESKEENVTENTSTENSVEITTENTEESTETTKEVVNESSDPNDEDFDDYEDFDDTDYGDFDLEEALNITLDSEYAVNLIVSENIFKESVDFTYDVVNTISENDISNFIENDVLEFDSESKNFIIEAIALSITLKDEKILEMAIKHIEEGMSKDIAGRVKRSGDRVYYAAKSAIHKGVEKFHNARANSALRRATKLDDKAKYFNQSGAPITSNKFKKSSDAALDKAARAEARAKANAAAANAAKAKLEKSKKLEAAIKERSQKRKTRQVGNEIIAKMQAAPA